MTNMTDTPTLYRLTGMVQALPHEVYDLINDGWLVPVTEVCIVHWQPPIDERGFCARGSEYDNGEWWEFDCDVRKVTDDGSREA